MQMKQNRVIIVGGKTSQVQELLEKIEERMLPVNDVRIVAEGDTCGEIHDFRGEPLLCGQLDSIPEEGFDLAILLSPVRNSRALVEILVNGRIPLLDGSGSIPPSDNVPVLWRLPILSNSPAAFPPVFVFPGHYTLSVISILEQMKHIGNLESVRLSLLQGASQAGNQRAMDELFDQARDILSFKEPTLTEWTHQLCFNAFPITEIQNEEHRFRRELQYGLDMRELTASLDVTWSSFFVGMLGTLWVTFREPIDLNQISRSLGNATELRWAEESESPGILDVVGQDEIYISKLRTDGTQRGVTLRIALDNIRAGFSMYLIALLESYLKEM